jgi:hypothetical protein
VDETFNSGGDNKLEGPLEIFCRFPEIPNYEGPASGEAEKRESRTSLIFRFYEVAMTSRLPASDLR